MSTPAAALDAIYTAGEAAERLRLTVRGVIKLARKYGYCSRAGRTFLLSEADLLALWQAMREPAQATPTVRLVTSTSGFLENHYRETLRKRIERDVRKEHRAAERKRNEELAARRRAEKEAQREERVRRMKGWAKKPEGGAE